MHARLSRLPFKEEKEPKTGTAEHTAAHSLETQQNLEKTDRKPLFLMHLVME